jgi:hypothetical protein
VRRSVLCHAGLLLCVMVQRSQIETFAEKNRPLNAVISIPLVQKIPRVTPTK